MKFFKEIEIILMVMWNENVRNNSEEEYKIYVWKCLR
jgi:hypothetical protein